MRNSYRNWATPPTRSQISYPFQVPLTITNSRTVKPQASSLVDYKHRVSIWYSSILGWYRCLFLKLNYYICSFLGIGIAHVTVRYCVQLCAFNWTLTPTIPLLYQKWLPKCPTHRGSSPAEEPSLKVTILHVLQTPKQCFHEYYQVKDDISRSDWVNDVF